MFISFLLSLYYKTRGKDTIFPLYTQARVPFSIYITQKTSIIPRTWSSNDNATQPIANRLRALSKIHVKCMIEKNIKNPFAGNRVFSAYAFRTLPRRLQIHLYVALAYVPHIRRM